MDETWSMSGAKSKEEFYDTKNPMCVIEYIREPFLCLNAEDDPLCVAENILESKHYFEDHREHNAAIAFTKTGSHCSFYEFSPFKPFFHNSWSEKVAFQFFDSVMNHIS
jgi:predicted alpha/beta-fold hydrolase